MEQFEDFKKRVTASWDGKAPEILCTGRTAYVAEMAGKMKGDITSTVASSVLLVALTFWIGFRRLRPLKAIVDALAFCCLIALALGAAIYGSLNMITVGLCAILVGLGVDFAMLLYGIYSSERAGGRSHADSIRAALRTHLSGIWSGALTTAAAFLCLLRSDCPGFQQLGVLIAIGILVAAFTMTSFFWLFLGKKVSPRGESRLNAAAGGFIHFALRHRRGLALAGLGLFAAAILIAVLPV
jgi:hypothetical protein